jgi:hypothetical protein
MEEPNLTHSWRTRKMIMNHNTKEEYEIIYEQENIINNPNKAKDHIADYYEDLKLEMAKTVIKHGHTISTIQLKGYAKTQPNHKMKLHSVRNN